METHSNCNEYGVPLDEEGRAIDFNKPTLWTGTILIIFNDSYEFNTYLDELDRQNPTEVSED